MARFGVQVRGGNRLRATMKKAGVDIKEMTALNKAAATVVAGTARARAPIGKPSRRRGRGRRKAPGALAKSVRPGATTKAAVIRAGSTRVPYANPIHWGWPSRNIRQNAFVSEAATATEGIWVKNYTRHMNHIIGRVKGI